MLQLDVSGLQWIMLAHDVFYLDMSGLQEPVLLLVVSCLQESELLSDLSGVYKGLSCLQTCLV